MKKTANKNISIVMPVHQVVETEKNMISRAIKSVVDCSANYTEGKLELVISTTKYLSDDILQIAEKVDSFNSLKVNVVTSDDTDFFTLMQKGVEECSYEYFSLLEYDDLYTDKWFNMWSTYYNTHEDVSVFLPITIRTNVDGTAWLFGNEIVWANTFTEEMGYIDADSLLNFMDYTLSGGVFNKEDFNAIGGFKSSMGFMYGTEFLMRLTHNKLKCYVVPKEGYIHTIDREGCMLTTLAGALTDDELNKWKKVALKESAYVEDRGTTIDDIKEEVLS